MKTLLTLLLTLPLFACEGESLMESPGATLEDTGDEIADTAGDAREDAEDGAEEDID